MYIGQLTPGILYSIHTSCRSHRAIQVYLQVGSGCIVGTIQTDSVIFLFVYDYEMNSIFLFYVGSSVARIGSVVRSF